MPGTSLTLTQPLPRISAYDACKIETEYGEFTLYGFKFESTPNPVIAYVKGDIEGAEWPLVRVHSKCSTGELGHSLHCDCADQLEKAFEIISTEGRGVIIYLDQEGLGNGLFAKIEIYKKMAREGKPASQVRRELGYEDVREYAEAAAVLAHFRINRIRLLTNNPAKIQKIENLSIAVERIPLIIPPNPVNFEYLEDKKRQGHLLDDDNPRIGWGR